MSCQQTRGRVCMGHKYQEAGIVVGHAGGCLSHTGSRKVLFPPLHTLCQYQLLVLSPVPLLEGTVLPLSSCSILLPYICFSHHFFLY